MTQRNIRRRDKVSAIISVCTIFCICVSVCLYFFISTQDTPLTSYKDMVAKKYERQENFRHKQAAVRAVCDSLYSRIERFDPNVNASFEENDIKFLINDLKGQYENSLWDKRYKVFYHISVFYDMWFADKKVLWSKKSNIITFRNNLEKCEMGLTKKEDELVKKQKR